jgi:ribose transport system permease protein
VVAGPAFWQRVGFVAALAALLVVFSARSEAFVHLNNLRNILAGSVVAALVCLAMTAVVSSGGIDLSVGTSLDVGAWVVVVAMLDWDLAWGPAMATALVASTLVGVANAVLITKLGVSPFLATLGVYFVGRSVQQAGTDGGATINFRKAPAAFHELAVGSTLGVPDKLWIGAVLAAALWFTLSRTVHGRRLEAIGSQPEAARHAGIEVGRYQAATDVGAAALCGVAGILLTAGLRLFTPLAGFAYQTDAIAAVFIGASLHSRGRANVPGTLAAVLFLEVLANGLDLMGLDFNAKVLVRGAVLVAALALSFGLAKRSVGWRS